MSRGHLISEKSAGNAKPVTSLDSGTSPRFRLKAVEYLGLNKSEAISHSSFDLYFSDN